MKYARSRGGLWVPEEYAQTRKPTAVDVFAGAGGFSLGLMRAGFEIVCAIEKDAFSAMTYLSNLAHEGTPVLFVDEEDERHFSKARAWVEKNQPDGIHADGRWRPGWHRPSTLTPVRSFIFGDIRKVSGKTVLELSGMHRGEINTLVGGPPCQGFSIANANRNAADPRNTLIFEMGRLIVDMRPHTFALENVAGVRTMKTVEGVPVLVQFEQILRDGGYDAYQALSEWHNQNEDAAMGGPRERRRPETAASDNAQPSLLAGL